MVEDRKNEDDEGVEEAAEERTKGDLPDAPMTAPNEIDEVIEASLADRGAVMIVNLGHVKASVHGLHARLPTTMFKNGRISPFGVSMRIPIPFATPEVPAKQFTRQLARDLLLAFGTTRGAGIDSGRGRTEPDRGLRVYDPKVHDPIIAVHAKKARGMNAAPPEGKVELGPKIVVGAAEAELLADVATGGGGLTHRYCGRGPLGMGGKGGRTY